MGIQIELSLVALYKGQALLREMLDMMDILGYDLHDVNPAFADENSGRVLQIDGIFFKR